ncbi:MAG: hypothetical protein AABX26_03565 [Nanoarchaeota archaeon]
MDDDPCVLAMLLPYSQQQVYIFPSQIFPNLSMPELSQEKMLVTTTLKLTVR